MFLCRLRVEFVHEFYTLTLATCSNRIFRVYNYQWYRYFRIIFARCSAIIYAATGFLLELGARYDAMSFDHNIVEIIPIWNFTYESIEKRQSRDFRIFTFVHDFPSLCGWSSRDLVYSAFVLRKRIARKCVMVMRKNFTEKNCHYLIYIKIGRA